VIYLDGEHLSCAEIAAAAQAGDEVRLTADARERIASSHERACRLSGLRQLYGRSTGVGANRDVAVTGVVPHALSLLRSHATSAGELRSPERVRAMLVVRANQLAAGGSGASPRLVDALLAMLTADALPLVRELGSIGTGDLPALATTALALIGEAPTANPLPATVELGAHDALPFLSSNAAAVADAAVGCTELIELSRAYVVVAALTFTAIRGNSEAFSQLADRTTPFAGARRTSRWMRSLLGPPTTAARIQDPFSVRALPQVHGPFVDALHSLDDVVRRLANAPAENPVVLANAAGEDDAAHHGGFHAAYLTSALTSVATSAASSAKLVLGRLSLLNDPELTGLRPFLADEAPAASGVMMLEYVAASALARLRTAATPVGLQAVVLSRGMEDDASFASLAARQAIDVAEGLRVMLGCELVAAVRALRQSGDPPLSGRLERAVAVTRAELPEGFADRDLSADIERAQELMGSLAELLAQ
jgi:histidine ammonia-lyase